MRSAALLALLALTACDPDAGRPTSEPHRTAASALSAVPNYDPDWRPPPTTATPTRGDADPLEGSFPLAAATASLPGTGDLVAVLETSMGTLRCVLLPTRAPRTVAQFIGLANGTRPYRTQRGWLQKPAYDGSRIHRVVPDALVVGGRPADAHADGIGLVTTPEPWEGMRHDEAGLLCAAGRGRHGAGELLLTGSKAPFDAHSTSGIAPPTVFGRCQPAALVDRMTRVPSAKGRPHEAIVLRRARVQRASDFSNVTPRDSAPTNSAGEPQGRQ